MMRTVEQQFDEDTGQGTVIVSHSSRQLVLENDNDDLVTGAEMPDGRLRCGGEVLVPKLRLRKESERADDHLAMIGLPLLQGWDEYASDSTRDDSLFETVVLSSAEADGSSAGVSTVLTATFLFDGSTNDYALEPQGASPDPEWEVNFAHARDAERKGKYGSALATVDLPAEALARLKALDESGEVCYFEISVDTRSVTPLVTSVSAQIDALKVGDDALELADRIARLTGRPGADRALLEVNLHGQVRAPVFLEIWVELGPMHGVMNMIKTLYQKLLVFAWGHRLSATLARHINHHRVNCGFKQTYTKLQFAIEQLMRIRGLQIGLLRHARPQDLLPDGVEKEAWQRLLFLAHFIADMIHMGPYRAQLALYGKATPESLVEFVKIMRRSFLAMMHVMFRFFPGDRKGAKGHVLNKWVTRSISIVWEIIRFRLPDGKPIGDEWVMEELNAEMRLVFGRGKNVVEEPAFYMLETMALNQKADLEALGVAERQAAAVKRHEKERAKMEPGLLERVRCEVMLLEEARNTDEAAEHHTMRFRRATTLAVDGFEKAAGYDCDGDAIKGPSPLSKIFKDTFVSWPDERVAAEGEPEGLAGAEDRDETEEPVRDVGTYERAGAEGAEAEAEAEAEAAAAAAAAEATPTPTEQAELRDLNAQVRIDDAQLARLAQLAPDTGDGEAQP